MVLGLVHGEHIKGGVRKPFSSFQHNLLCYVSSKGRQLLNGKLSCHLTIVAWGYATSQFLIENLRIQRSQIKAVRKSQTTTFKSCKTNSTASLGLFWSADLIIAMAFGIAWRRWRNGKLALHKYEFNRFSILEQKAVKFVILQVCRNYQSLKVQNQEHD